MLSAKYPRSRERGDSLGCLDVCVCGGCDGCGAQDPKKASIQLQGNADTTCNPPCWANRNVP